MRQILVILALLGTIVGGAYWYYHTHFHPDIPAEVTVEKVEGEARRGDSSGAEVQLREGEKLSGSSRVKTGKGGLVRLAVEKGEEVDLRDDSELVIKQVSSEGVNFELKQGRIEARVKRFRDRARTVTVGVTGNPSAVRTREGEFAVVANGLGSMDVAGVSGDVELVSGPGGRPEKIPAGERRVVAADGDRVLAGKVPRSVLLKVDWPDGAIRREHTLEVAGSVTPGSRLTVAGQLVRPGKDGSFKTMVPLQEGRNRIEVEATGMGEPARAESPDYRVDTRPPRVDTRTDGIWK